MSATNTIAALRQELAKAQSTNELLLKLVKDGDDDSLLGKALKKALTGQEISASFVFDEQGARVETQPISVNITKMLVDSIAERKAAEAEGA